MKPLDPIRAGGVAWTEGRFVYFCDIACKRLYMGARGSTDETREPPRVVMTERPRAASVETAPEVLETLSFFQNEDSAEEKAFEAGETLYAPSSEAQEARRVDPDSASEDPQAGSSLGSPALLALAIALAALALALGFVPLLYGSIRSGLLLRLAASAFSSCLKRAEADSMPMGTFGLRHASGLSFHSLCRP
jgi:hypothetical protein